jgi:membrane protein implicated in regulation of membrane protease activity
MIGLLAVGLLGVFALIADGYCLWLTTTSLSYRRVDIVENELCLSLGVFVIALISSVVIIVRWRRSRLASPKDRPNTARLRSHATHLTN